jgi:hypothetical protein
MPAYDFSGERGLNLKPAHQNVFEQLNYGIGSFFLSKNPRRACAPFLQPEPFSPVTEDALAFMA